MVRISKTFDATPEQHHRLRVLAFIKEKPMRTLVRSAIAEYLNKPEHALPAAFKVEPSQRL